MNTKVLKKGSIYGIILPCLFPCGGPSWDEYVVIPPEEQLGLDVAGVQVLKQEVLQLELGRALQADPNEGYRRVAGGQYNTHVGF